MPSLPWATWASEPIFSARELCSPPAGPGMAASPWQEKKAPESDWTMPKFCSSYFGPDVLRVRSCGSKKYSTVKDGFSFLVSLTSLFQTSARKLHIVSKQTIKLRITVVVFKCSVLTYCTLWRQYSLSIKGTWLLVHSPFSTPLTVILDTKPFSFIGRYMAESRM